MKLQQFPRLLVLILALSVSCDRDDPTGDFHVDGLTIDNYPLIDGSTSAEPLQMLVARTASEDEWHVADSLGVGLTETPVALDAFVFLNHISNPVRSLTTGQIRDIYKGRITHWDQVGGNAAKINAYMRERNSGSQELMESLVMKDLDMPDLPDMIVFGMMGLINRIEYDRQGLGYSVHYYTRYMVRSDSTQLLSVDGAYPGADEIKKRKYPYVTEVYAVIRDDLERSSMAYRIYELFSTPAGQEVIGGSGYIPYH